MTGFAFPVDFTGCWFRSVPSVPHPTFLFVIPRLVTPPPTFSFCPASSSPRVTCVSVDLIQAFGKLPPRTRTHCRCHALTTASTTFLPAVLPTYVWQHTCGPEKAVLFTIITAFAVPFTFGRSVDFTRRLLLAAGEKVPRLRFVRSAMAG